MEEMSARFVNIDHDTPMLLPPDLRDWVPPTTWSISSWTRSKRWI
jgi:hypothetical protein